jgi:hypothetical protein
LAMANGGDANDLSSRDSADEESAYQLPKKVSGQPLHSKKNHLLHEATGLTFCRTNPKRTTKMS